MSVFPEPSPIDLPAPGAKMSHGPIHLALKLDMSLVSTVNLAFRLLSGALSLLLGHVIMSSSLFD